MKILWFSFELIGGSIAYKLLQEGNDVIVGQIQDVLEFGNGDRPEKPEEKKMRLSNYDGILPKYPAKVLLEKMKNMPDKENVLVIFDFNNMWKYAQEALKMGFTKGFFPTKADYTMEADRDKAKDIVKKYYKGLEVAEVKEFKQAQEGIQFLQETEEMWALKGNADEAETVVPDTENPEFSKQQQIDALEKDSKHYEKKGFLLEKRITNPIELTPEICFYDGKPVYAALDIENKPMGAGNEGKQCGCGQNLLVKMELDHPLAKLAFPQFVHDEAKRRKGIFFWDASILCEDGKYYFGEFCANRWGFDSIQTELTMCDSVTDYFKSVMLGDNPLKKKYGAAVRGFNKNEDKHKLEENKMTWLKDVDKQVWVYEMKLDEDGNPVNSNTSWDLVVFTGAGETLGQAVKQAYKARKGFSYKQLESRPQFDFLSKDYPTSIPNRLDYYQTNFKSNER